MKQATGSFLLAAALLIPAAGQADDLAVVKAFYSELLSNGAAENIKERAAKVVVENWVSVPTPRGGPDREGFVKSLQGFGAAIPDLKWEPQEILQSGNRYIVRSRATGTPVLPMFGIDPPTGNSFEIMSIDIHTVENGLIVQSYHVEEWLQAVRQLEGGH